LELRVLRYFLAVAREETITGAANLLHVTQPTLSRQIHDLEQELGQKLLVRGSHRVSLTPAGMLLRKRAEEIVSMVDKTEGEFSAIDTEIAGDVYIGGGETRGLFLIAQTARELREEYPGVRYHLYSGNSQDVAERLEKGLLDFGVFVHPADLSRYESLELPEKERWGVVIRKDDPLAQKKAVRREELADQPLIVSRQAMEAGRDNAYARWFGESFEALNISTTFNLVYNAALMVEAGLGCALTIDRLVNISPESALTFLPLEPKLETGLSLVWKRHQVFSAAAEAFLERLKSKCASA